MHPGVRQLGDSRSESVRVRNLIPDHFWPNSNFRTGFPEALLQSPAASRRVLTALRNRTFFSLVELNAAIAKLLERPNNRPFRKLPGSRRELFKQLDRPALRPLPAERCRGQ